MIRLAGQIEEVPENVIGWLSKYGVQKLGELQVASRVSASAWLMSSAVDCV